MADAAPSSRIGVDVGGTFTDVIVQRADGPRPTEPATVAGVVHGTTVATNAVLERRGARTELVTTAGFRDVLELRRLRIPHMYDPFWRKPEPLVPRRLRLELNERVAADGAVLRPVDEAEVSVLAALLEEA